jgi:membrane-bound lytic murein transglycosylase A
MRLRVRLAVLVAATLTLAACAGPGKPVVQHEEDGPLILDLAPAEFSQLDGWAGDDHAAALATYVISCDKIEAKAADAPMGGSASMGLAGAWQEICAIARGTRPQDARIFFETWFRPWLATASGQPDGLFTGYYEPQLHGSLTPDATYRYPLYAVPQEENLPDRAAIDAGALAGKGLELVWVDSAVDSFFLHIQGSGRVALDDGGELRIGYAGKNGHEYFAIRHELVDRGALKPEEITAQSIRAWLNDHPDEAFAVMATNPSYTFFRILEGPGPVGAQGVPLTPGRSLAIDRAHLALGVPVWLETTLVDGTPWERLMVTQDTGGAIKGPVRGDIFFGHGAEAEWHAGQMQHMGRTWLLLPHLLSADVLAYLQP